MSDNATKVNARTIIQQKTKVVKDDIDVLIDPTAPFIGKKDKYFILGTINVSSGEATIYQVKNSQGDILAAKHYKSGLKEDDRQKLLDFLTNLKEDSNIMPIKDYGTHYGTPFDIVPYYRDKDITNLGPISIEMMKNVILPSVLKGIREIHDHNFVHRDIKPENLFYIRSENKVIIGDFGITSDLKEGIDFRRTTIGRGTRGYMAPEINLKNVYKSSDYYSLGVTIVCLIEGRYIFGDDDEATIYRKLLNNSFSNGIQDQTLRQLIRGLTIQDPNSRFGFEEVYAYITDRPFKQVMDIDRAEMYKLSKVYHFEGNAYNDFKQLAQAFLENWNRATEHLKRGLIEAHFEGINSDIVLFVQELLENNTSIDVALSKFLYLINPQLGICYKGKGYTMREILDLMREFYPNMNEDILEMIKEDVFLFMAKNKFKNSPNTENEKLMNYITTIEDINDNEVAYYTFLFTNYKELSIYYRQKQVGRANEIADFIIESNDNRLAVKMAQDKIFLGYIASEIGIDAMFSFTEKNQNTSTKEINYNMIELLYNLTHKEGLNNLAHIGFTRWLVDNYDNYNYRGKEAKDVLLQLKRIPKVNALTDFSIIRGIITDTEMIYNEFMQYYQHDLIMRASNDGIFASEAKYYIGIEFEKEMVCEEYLKDINVMFNKRYIEELKLNELKMASERIDQIRGDLETTKEEINLIIKDHLGDEHVKINKGNTVRLIFIMISIFVLFTLCGIVFAPIFLGSRYYSATIVDIPFLEISSWDLKNWLYYSLSFTSILIGIIMYGIALSNISKESGIINYQNASIRSIENSFKLFDNLKTHVQNMVKDASKNKRYSKVDFDPLYDALKTAQKDFEVISKHKTPSKVARRVTSKLGTMTFTLVVVITLTRLTVYYFNSLLPAYLPIDNLTIGLYYGVILFVVIILFLIGIKKDKMPKFFAFIFKNIFLILLISIIFYGFNYIF